jgi:hypothetical protein
MLHETMGTLLRRGVEIGHAHFQKDPQQTYKLPTWGAIVMGLTVLFFFAASSIVSSLKKPTYSLTSADV